MKVAALEPGDVFGGQSAESDSESQPGAWYFKVVLDDTGIDPA